MFESAFLFRRVTVGLALAHLAACASTPRPAEDELVGPLLGHVSDRSANVWMHGGPGARFRLEYAEAALTSSPDAWRSVALGDGTTPDAIATMTGLAPETSYRYRVVPLHDADAWPAWGRDRGVVDLGGTFTTAPPPGTPTRTA